MISRRHSLALLASPILPASFARGAEPAGRRIDLQIADGFGKASAADIKAMLLSAANAIWTHCPNTRWEVPGFHVYHSTESPITLNDHRADGRIAIGVTTQGTYWAQFAFQFAHEFCHALAGHSNDWKRTWIRGRKANHWLEESICEVASLFALRSMGKSWQTAPPYPNWKDFSAALTKYAADRLEKSGADLPQGRSFAEWFRENEPSMREHSTLREKNNIVALQLLPLFEATPSGWESMTSYNLVKREPEKTLSTHLADWAAAAPEGQKAFIRQIAAVFEVS